MSEVVCVSTNGADLLAHDNKSTAHSICRTEVLARPLRASSDAMNDDSALPMDYQHDDHDRARERRRTFWKKVLVWSGIVVGGCAVLVACVYFPWATVFAYFFETVEALGAWGNALMVAAFVVISFPFTFGYIPLSLGCGYLYGVVWGTLTAGFGANAGAVLCFVLVRVMLRPFCLAKLQTIPQASMFLGDGTRESGISFWTATLWRFAPIPFGFSNALFALSSIPLARFAGSTVIGLMPFQVMWVYLGTTLRSLTDAANGNIEGSTAQYVSLFLQLFVGLLAPMYMAYRSCAKKPVAEDQDAIELEELGGRQSQLADSDDEEMGIPLDSFTRVSAVRLSVSDDAQRGPLGSSDFV